MSLASPIAYGLDPLAAPPQLVRWRGGRAEPVPLAAARGTVERDIASGRAVLAVAAGAHESVLRRLTAPIASREKARRVLPSLLDVQLPFPLERCVCAFPDLRTTSDRQTDALAVAVRHDEFQSVLRRAAGLLAEPTHLDHEALAAWDQARRECPALGAGVHAVLLAATDHLTCVVARGDRLLAAPTVRLPPDGNAAGAAARFAPLLRAALEGEHTASFPWFLGGAGLDDAGAARIQDALGRPQGTVFHLAQDPASLLARAVARRAATRCAQPCNFRTGSFQHPALTARLAAGTARAQWTALAAGLFLLAGSFAWSGWLDRRADALRAELNREAVALTGLPRVPRGQEVELARRALKERDAKPDPFLAAMRPSTLDLLAQLAARAGDAQATISRLRIADPSFEAALRSSRADAGEKMVAAFAALGWNSELQVAPAGADGVTAFTIKGAR